jgi:hypothetical protein
MWTGPQYRSSTTSVMPTEATESPVARERTAEVRQRLIDAAPGIRKR